MSDHRMLPYGRQWVTEEDVDAVCSVLTSDFLTTGPAVDSFERALCRETGALHAAVLNSGTSALHAAYASLGVGPGDRVITSPLTFAATANVALHLGAEVVFADVDERTGNIDPAAVESLMDGRTRLIVAVDYAGHPANYPALRVLAEKQGAKLVADAAHSLGASLHGIPVGMLGDLTALSFHPVKSITSGEGGAVLGSEESLIRWIREFRSHGVVRERSRLREPEGPWHYEMQSLGFNYRLPDILCALGERQVSRLSSFITRRREIALRYSNELADCESIQLPTVQSGAESSWHLYPVRIRGHSKRRLAFFNRLRELGLGVQVHYLPVYRHPFWENMGYREGLCPKAEDFYQREVSLPIYPLLSDADAGRVVETVKVAAREVLD